MRAFLGLLLVPLAAALAEPATGVLILPCLDTTAIRQQFLEGEVEEVYSLWETYLRNAIQTQVPISRDCGAKAEKMLGVLNLLLPSKRDTSLSTIHLATVLKLAPRAEMWDLWLPLETQTYWDAFREKYGRRRTAIEIWEDRWLPPVAFTPTLGREALQLRNAYHRNRLLYANARDDANNFYKIMADTRNFQDPTFTLLRTDVMLRLGTSIAQAKRELDKIEGVNSLVVAGGDLVSWYGRLGTLIQERSQTLEKDSVPHEERRVQLKVKARKDKE